MTKEEFWQLIETVKKNGGSDISEREVALATQLSDLRLEEIASFQEIFSDYVNYAYTWDLWGAAYLIQGGCGDDGFSDFRSALISLGEKVFESTVKDPDGLSLLEDEEIDNLYHEGFQYVAQNIYEKKAKADMPFSGVFPEEPAGSEWDFDNQQLVKKKFPSLYSRFSGNA